MHRISHFRLSISPAGNLYAMSESSLIATGTANNPGLGGMIPVGVRFAHYFDPAGTQLGLPCPDEVENGWQDLSEVLP